MTAKKLPLIKVCVAIINIFFMSESAKSEKLLHKAHKHSHKHGHKHDGHNHGSKKFEFGLGLTTAMALDKEEKDEHGDDEHHMQSDDAYKNIFGPRPLAHGGGAGDAGVETAPALSLNAAYHLLSNTELISEFEYNTEEGVEDPLIGVSLEFFHPYKIESTAFLTASIPLSEESSENKKMTTLTAGWGPSIKRGRFTFSGAGLMEYSINGAKEEEEEDNTAGASYNPYTSNMAVEEEEEHEHEDRETFGVGAKGGVDYRVTRAISAGTGAVVIQKQHESGEASYVNDVNVIKGSYQWKQITGSAGFSLVEEAKSIGLPSKKYFEIGVQCIIY